MSGVGTVTAPATEASLLQAAPANGAPGTTATQSVASGLPPVPLAGLAAANTLNAGLVSSLLGVDPASVVGVFGGAGQEGGLFAGEVLLPLLTTLTHATAEQALALIGVQTPTPGGAGTSAGVSGAPAAVSSAPATSPVQVGSGPMVVDPLWGRSA